MMATQLTLRIQAVRARVVMFRGEPRFQVLVLSDGVWRRALEADPREAFDERQDCLAQANGTPQWPVDTLERERQVAKIVAGWKLTPAGWEFTPPLPQTAKVEMKPAPVEKGGRHGG